MFRQCAGSALKRLFIIAIIDGIFGFLGIAKILFFIFIVFFLIALIGGLLKKGSKAL